MRESVTVESSTEEILQNVGALHSGHFLLTSGLHSQQYIQSQRLLQYPRYAAIIAQRLAAQVLEAGIKVNAVIGPALGAIHLEVFVAAALDQRSDEPIRAMFAERNSESPIDPNSFTLRRGIELSPDDRLLVVEDVTTTGGSVKKVINLVDELGAKAVAVAAIVDRSGSTIDFGIPFFKLITLSLTNYEQAQCPMCKQGTKAVKPGSSKK
jgi:orotate phosphoribosyltransferase